MPNYCVCYKGRCCGEEVLVQTARNQKAHSNKECQASKGFNNRNAAKHMAQAEVARSQQALRKEGNTQHPPPRRATQQAAPGCSNGLICLKSI